MTVQSCILCRLHTAVDTYLNFTLLMFLCSSCHYVKFTVNISYLVTLACLVNDGCLCERSHSLVKQQTLRFVFTHVHYKDISCNFDREFSTYCLIYIVPIYCTTILGQTILNWYYINNETMYLRLLFRVVFYSSLWILLSN